MTIATISVTPKSGRNSDQMALRFPIGQRAIIKARAAANRRTMNAEVLVLIEAGIAATDAVTRGAA